MSWGMVPLEVYLKVFLVLPLYLALKSLSLPESDLTLTFLTLTQLGPGPKLDKKRHGTNNTPECSLR